MKQNYSAPEVQILELPLEEAILQVSGKMPGDQPYS